MYQIYTDFEPLMILKNELTYLVKEGNKGAFIHLKYLDSITENNISIESRIKVDNNTHTRNTINSCCSKEQLDKYTESINKALLALKLDELRKLYNDSTDEKKANINESDWYMFLDHLCKNELTIDDIFKRLRIPKETNDKKI